MFDRQAYDELPDDARAYAREFLKSGALGSMIANQRELLKSQLLSVNVDQDAQKVKDDMMKLKERFIMLEEFEEFLQTLD